MGGFGVNIFLTDDKDISGLHEKFLGIKGPTDVMAFPPFPPPRSPADALVAGGGRPALSRVEGVREGEIMISLDTAARQARERKIPLRWELTLLAVHGILHLNGFRDEVLKDWKKMRIAEFETMVRII